MNAVIQLVAVAGQVRGLGAHPQPGQYLRRYDPEARAGHGQAEWTAALDEALTFPDGAAAFACWRTVPRSRPFREDGRPNRPLTAYTVEIVSLPETPGRVPAPVGG